MEAFSLLKYWRGGGGGLVSSSDTTSPTPTPTATAAATTTTTTIFTAVAQTDENATDTDDDTDDGDDGPFFDLEFTLPDEVDDSEIPNAKNSEHHSEEEQEDDGEREFKFTLSPSSNDRSDSNLSLSPSDDLFFKGKLVQVEPSSFEPNSKPQFTASSLLKSATKFRVFMLGLKKSKSNTASDKDSNASDSSAAPNPKPPETQLPESLKKQPERKLFTVKFKVEEVPIMSLFTRDNSSRGNNNKSHNHNPEDSPSSSSDEKRFSKEAMHKYLKMVKPLYIRVSRRYGEKLGFSGPLNLSSGGKAAPPPATADKKPAPAKAVAEKAQTEADGAAETGGTNSKSQKQGNLPAGLRVVCKHLGKSRSASSAVAAAPPPALLSSKRRDDSLLQQQDGIQGAILHCKRSFNASRECESSQLPRSVSDPLHEISSELSRKSMNEGKEKRLGRVFHMSSEVEEK